MDPNFYTQRFKPSDLPPARFFPTAKATPEPETVAQARKEGACQAHEIHIAVWRWHSDSLREIIPPTDALFGPILAIIKQTNAKFQALLAEVGYEP